VIFIDDSGLMEYDMLLGEWFWTFWTFWRNVVHGQGSSSLLELHSVNIGNQFPITVPHPKRC